MENKKFKHLHIYRECDKNVDNDIGKFEKKYSICFPNTYRVFLSQYGGGRFIEENFDFINSRGQLDERDAAFFCFSELYHENKHLQDPLYYGVKNLIGFASTAEGDTVCFDYRDNPKTCEPKIVVLVHDEYETDPDGYEHMKVEPVAESFDAFLDMLYEFQDDEES